MRISQREERIAEEFKAKGKKPPKRKKGDLEFNIDKWEFDQLPISDVDCVRVFR